MITINKITTKTGDQGKTLGPGTKMIDKFDCNIEFLGNLDELNCIIGLCKISKINLSFLGKNLQKNFQSKKYLKRKKINLLIEELQNQIFDIGAMFFKKDTKECDEFINMLEEKISCYNQNLPSLDSFLLPNDSKFILRFHHARVIARKAERSFWAYFQSYKKDNSDPSFEQAKMEKIGIYLNRLSDLMFAIIRNFSSKKWIPKAKRERNI